MVPETPQKPPKTRLDTAVNIAILLVCALAVFILVPKAIQTWQSFRSPGPAMVEKGDRFDEIKAVLPAGTNRALVVALSPGCHFCNESMPFYKQILDQRNQKSSPVKFIAAVPNEEAKAEEAQKLASAGATPDGLVKLDFAAVKVPGTPTLMLVDNNGEVLDVWVGKLEADREKEVLAAL